MLTQDFNPGLENGEEIHMRNRVFIGFLSVLFASAYKWLPEDLLFHHGEVRGP